MSVATEITRIQGAKADLKTAIEAKGVTVPSDTLISGYASLVDQISGGSGLPDSDGLVDLSIATGDMTAAASTLTLTYIPRYLLRYSPSSAISDRSGFTISKSVTYPAVVWSCNKPALTISGATVSIPGSFDDDVAFTATWVDYSGSTRTTTKTIHVIGIAAQMISVQSVTTSSSSKYIVTTEWPSNIGVTQYETYSRAATYYICTGQTYYAENWGHPFSVLSTDGSTGAAFNSSAEAKAAIDTL